MFDLLDGRTRLIDNEWHGLSVCQIGVLNASVYWPRILDRYSAFRKSHIHRRAIPRLRLHRHILPGSRGSLGADLSRSSELLRIPTPYYNTGCCNLRSIANGHESMRERESIVWLITAQEWPACYTIYWLPSASGAMPHLRALCLGTVPIRRQFQQGNVVCFVCFGACSRARYDAPPADMAMREDLVKLDVLYAWCSDRFFSALRSAESMI